MAFFVVSALVACQTAHSRDFFVAPGDTDCEFNDGSREFPFCQIQEGIDAAFADGGGKVAVEPGVYAERITLREDVEIEASEDGEVIIEAPIDGAPTPYVVIGAPEAKLEQVTIRVPSDYGTPAVLIYISGFSMTIEEVILDGASNPNSTGILVEGRASSETRIKKTLITRLNVGLEAVDTAAEIERNVFTEILRDAIYIRPPDSGDPPYLVPQLGEDDILESSGFNRFREIGGEVPEDDKGIAPNSFFIRNTAGATVFAQLNDWDLFDAAEIAARLSTEPPGKRNDRLVPAVQQADSIVFEPFLGNSLFPGSIFVRIEDSITGAILDGAVPGLLRNGIDTNLTPAFDDISGLFSFEGLAPDTYTVRAAAPGYATENLVIVVGPGDIEAREITLTGGTPLLNPPVLTGTTPDSPSVDGAPSVEGTAVPGATVSLFVNSVFSGDVVPDSSGTFTIIVDHLSLGVHSLHATVSLTGFEGSLPSNVLFYEVLNIDQGEGTGEIENIAVMPTSLAFGSIPIGAHLDAMLMLHNAGAGTVGGNIQVQEPFAVLGSGEFSIPSESDYQAIVRFTPAVSGPYESVITIGTSEGILVPVSGSGAADTQPQEGGGEQMEGGCAASPVRAEARRVPDFAFVLLVLGVLALCAPFRGSSASTEQTN